MAIIKFKEKWETRTGDFTLQPSSGKQTNTVVRGFLVVTDNKNDDHAEILADFRCPKFGQQHPTLQSLFVVSVKPRAEFGPKIWTVTVAYSDERNLTDDPTTDPAEIVWGGEQFQTPFTKDRDGKAVLNSAGDFFDPPHEIDDSRSLATITKNVPVQTHVGLVLGFRNVINSDDIVIDGVDVGSKKAKIQWIEVSQKRERNDIAYRTLTIPIHLNEDSWEVDLLDQGYREKDPADATKRIQIRSDDETELSAPAMLDGAGAKLANPSLDNAKYLTKGAYKLKAFKELPLA